MAAVSTAMASASPEGLTAKHLNAAQQGLHLTGGEKHITYIACLAISPHSML